MPRTVARSAQFPSAAAALLGQMRIFDCAEPEWQRELGDHVGQKNGSFTGPLSKILQHAADLGCKTVLAEPYISTDWADEYQAWYSRLFQDVPREAIRLHFFRGLGKHARLLKMEEIYNLPSVLKNNCPNVPNGETYLGYVVIRPLSPLTVGETVLMPPLDTHATCTASFPVHLLGYELTVRGMPFMEQEQGVSVCAEATLWTLARYKHALGQTRRYRPSEMEDLAAEQQRLGSTRDGLTDDQMYAALWKMDFNPRLFTSTEPAEVARHLYTYLRSGIPLILTLDGPNGGHAVTVVGFVEPDGSKRPRGMRKNWPEFLPTSFLVHDDEKGPYLVQSLSVGKQDGSAYAKLDGMRIASCFRSVPHRVHLTDDDVKVLAQAWLGDLVLEQGHGSDTPSSYWRLADLQGLETRAFLARSDQLKKDVADRHVGKGSSVDLELVARYWRALLPKHVWVVELYHRADDSKVEMVGHMILDATAHYRDMLGVMLMLHLKGRLLARLPGPRKQGVPLWTYTEGLASAPYTPFCPA